MVSSTYTDNHYDHSDFGWGGGGGVGGWGVVLNARIVSQTDRSSFSVAHIDY